MQQQQQQRGGPLPRDRSAGCDTTLNQLFAPHNHTRPLPPPPHRQLHQICRRIHIRSNQLCSSSSQRIFAEPCRAPAGTDLLSAALAAVGGGRVEAVAPARVSIGQRFSLVGKEAAGAIHAQRVKHRKGSASSSTRECKQQHTHTSACTAHHLSSSWPATETCGLAACATCPFSHTTCSCRTFLSPP